LTEISSAFETMAEISIAVAGFAGIIVVLGERIDQLHPADRLRLWWLLSNSAGGVVLGILPSVLVSAAVHETTIWRVWSASYLVVGAIWLGVSLPMFRAMTKADRRNFLGPNLPVRVSNAALNLLSAANVALQVLNALGLVLHGVQWVCLAGLLFLLFASVSTLVTLIFLRPNRSAA
jgi:hypothetical protein